MKTITGHFKIPIWFELKYDETKQQYPMTEDHIKEILYAYASDLITDTHKQGTIKARMFVDEDDNIPLDQIEILDKKEFTER